ncbi:MAG: glycosyltransferase family 39 protein [Thermoflexales bacterium]|nr:glycosyltransferase family 39 protein [Thermoflexales bacterium]
MIKNGHQDVLSRRQWALVALCLVAFGLRLPPLWADRFHPDEALYASWGLLIRTGRDVWLSSQAADKPPVAFYLMALSFNYVWRCEAAARLPGLLAGTLCVPLGFQVSGSRFKDVAWVTAALVAFSPYMIAFSPTAFLDPLMVAFALAAWAAAGRGRAFLAGILLGLSAATKLTGLLFLPLVGFQIATRAPLRNGLSQLANRKFGSGLVVVLALVLIWDRVKGGTPFWVQQAINYEGARLVPLAEALPRLQAWLSFFPYFFGRPALVAFAIIAVVQLVLCVLRFTFYACPRGEAKRVSRFTLHVSSLSRQAWLPWLGFGLFYLAVHCLLAFQLWDRYLLGLVPVAALLAAHITARFVSGFTFYIIPSLPRDVSRFTPYIIPSLPRDVSRFMSSRACRGTFYVLLLILLLPPALTAAGSGYPVGGDHGAYDGIEGVADYLRARPEGTVVYDHWLGWEFRYYLWDAPVYVAHFPEPGWLRDDLRLWGQSAPRYVTVPAYVSADPVLEAVAQAGFGASPVLATISRRGQPTFTVYEIIPGK